MKNVILAFVKTLLLGYVALLVLMFFFQRSLLYQRMPLLHEDQSKTREFSTGNVKWLATVDEKEGEKALIYFCGNADYPPANLPALRKAFPDQSIYIQHYRGFAGSGGSPTEAGLVQDGLALFDTVAKNHNEVTVIGRSLGTGVAVQVASQRQPYRLILVTPYNSITDIAARSHPLFPVRWLLFDTFESWRFAGKVTAPTLFLVGNKDTLIPPENSQLLMDCFPKGNAQMIILNGADHNLIQNHPDYFHHLLKFLQPEKKE